MLKRLMMNVNGIISPCHRPAQKPAGAASVCWYCELGPAIANTFAMLLLLFRSLNVLIRFALNSVSVVPEDQRGIYQFARHCDAVV